MKRLIYVLAIAVVAVISQSCEPVPNLDQKGTISGVVTDATTGEPIAGCEVYLSRYTPAERIAPRDYYNPIRPRERVRKLAEYQGFELTEAEFLMDRQENTISALTGMNLKLATEAEQRFGMDSPDILRLRQNLADEFEIPKQRIKIQIN